jgi:outer membrane protein TolC
MRSRSLCFLAGLAVAGAIGFFQPAPAQAQVAPSGTAVVLPTPLSLDQALQIALRQQPTRYAALAQVNSSKGQKQEAVAQYFPSVIPTYSYQNKSTAVFGVQATPVQTQGGGTFTPPVNEVNIIRGGGLSVAIDQNIYNGGQTEQANAEARHNLDAAELGLENTRQTIIETVTQDFYNLLADEDLVTVAKASVAQFQSTVDQTQAQITAGTVAKNDIYQAQANLANAQVTQMQAQIAAQTASATLKNAMGVESDATAQPVPLAATGELPPLPQATTTDTLDDYIKQAYQSRPDLLQQQAQTQSSLAALRLARQQAGLNLSADYVVSYQATNDLGERGVDTSLLVTGTYPLFDAGSARGAVRAAQGNYDASRNQLDSVRQAVRLDVEVAYNQRAQFLQSAQLAQTAVQAAQVNYNSAVAGRAAGVGTILDIITAEQTLTQAQNQYVSAIYNYYIADSQLQKAIGRNETPATMSVQ